jgi:DNA repair protein RadC
MAVHSPITDWPKNEQPREKLRLNGAAALSDAELLAIFLRVGVKGKSAVALAKDLLHHFGSLPRLLASTPQELTRIHGMGLSKWSQIQAACSGDKFLNGPAAYALCVRKKLSQ